MRLSALGKTRAKAQQAGASVCSGVREGGRTEKVTVTPPCGERVGDAHMSAALEVGRPRRQRLFPLFIVLEPRRVLGT